VRRTFSLTFCSWKNLRSLSSRSVRRQNTVRGQTRQHGRHGLEWSNGAICGVSDVNDA